METNAVCLACDDAFSYVAGVAIESLLNSTQGDRVSFDVYLLVDNVSEENISRLHSVANQYGKTLQTVDVSGRLNSLRKIAADANGYKGSFSYYSRIYFDELVDASIKRVLYLDCDVSVCGSLDELWELDLGDKVVAAVQETHVDAVLRKKLTGSEAFYFNSGVMLIDVDGWRVNGLKRRAAALAEMRVRTNNERLRDQPLINIACSGSVHRLPPKYNVYAPVQMYTPSQARYAMRCDEDFYTESELQDAKDAPVILHYYKFIGSRPWQRWCFNPTAGVWEVNARRTPWGILPKQNPGKPRVELLSSILFRLSPRLQLAVQMAHSAWKALK